MLFCVSVKIAAEGQDLHLTHSTTIKVAQFKEGCDHIFSHLVILKDFRPESDRTACNFKMIATRKIAMLIHTKERYQCLLSASHPKKHDKQNINAM